MAKMRLINPLNISRILSTILLIEAGFFISCLPVAFIYREPVMSVSFYRQP